MLLRRISALLAWTTIVAVAAAPGCQIISGEADRVFPESACENAVACESCDQGGCCVEDCADCECKEGCTCHFSCLDPPCDSECKENSTCFGECAAGAPCKLKCSKDSACTLHCNGLSPDTDDCKLEGCGGDELELCPNGTTLVCRAPCP